MSRSDTVDNIGEKVSPFEQKFEKRDYFSAVSRLNLLSKIRQDIADQVSIIVITGDDGSGKSVLYTMLKEGGFPERMPIYFDGSIQSFGEVIRLVAAKVDLEVSDLSRSGKTKALDEIAARVEEKNLQIVLVCDEAEKIFLATLERIRKMLDKLNTSGVHMQVVLVGRELLLENLEQLKICKFEEVPETRYLLEPLSLSETTLYLQRYMPRLRPEQAALFTPEVIDRIYRAADGNICKIKQLSSGVLRGEDVAEKPVDVVTKHLKIPKVHRSIKRKMTGTEGEKRKVPLKVFGILASAVAFGIFAFMLTGGDGPPPEGKMTSVEETAQIVPVMEDEKVEKSTEQPQQAEALSDSDKSLSAESETGDTSTVQSDSTAREAAQLVTTQVVETTPEIEQNVTEESVAATVFQSNRASSVIEETQVDKGTASEQFEKKTALVSPVAESVQVREDTGVEKEAVADDHEKAEQKITTSEQQSSAINQQDSAQEIVSEVPLLRPERIKKLIKREGVLIPGTGGAASSIVISSLTSSDGSDIPFPDDENIKKHVPVQEEKSVDVTPPAEKSRADLRKNQQETPAAADENRETITETNAKKLQQVGEAIVPVVDQSAIDSLYQKRLVAGRSWLTKGADGKYTLQLMVLSSESARENMNRILSRTEYGEYIKNFYIFEKDSTPSSIFVFYGEYNSMTAARDARDSVPEVLKKHNPYVLSVPGAVRKVN